MQKPTTGEIIMKYSIDRERISGELTQAGEANGEKSATKLAREMAKKYPDDRIYVSWFRSSDNQHGFLNPGGDHAITGEAW